MPKRTSPTREVQVRSPKVCSYCKGRDQSVEHSRPKDCPRYQAYRAGKGKKSRVARPTGSGVKSVGGGASLRSSPTCARSVA